MKKLMFMLLLAGSIQAMYAQKFSPNTPLFEELTDVKKKTDKLFLSYPFSFFIKLCKLILRFPHLLFFLVFLVASLVHLLAFLIA